MIWPENNASYNATDALFDLNDSRAEKGVLDFAIGKNFSRFVEIELEMLEPDAEVEILDMGFEIRGKKKQGS